MGLRSMRRSFLTWQLEGGLLAGLLWLWLHSFSIMSTCRHKYRNNHKVAVIFSMNSFISKFCSKSTVFLELLSMDSTFKS